MAINNKSDLKHKKEAGLDSFITVGIKPYKGFTLVEPDEVLEGYTVDSYRDAITNQLRYFETTFFERNGCYLSCNTHLTQQDILQMQSRKMRIDIPQLLDCINGKSQSFYKTLDEFKACHIVKIEDITLMQFDWSDVVIERPDDERQSCYPEHIIWFNLKHFSLSSYTSRNMFNAPCYASYLTSIEYDISCLKFGRSITKYTVGEKYNEAFKVFSIDMYDHEYYETYGDKPITVTFNFNIDLYFSHLKYLYKVIQTYA